MRKKRKDVFLKIIKTATPDECRPDMADLVMQQINAVEEEEVAVNPALKKLLVKHGTESAPHDLTRNVMAQITPLDNYTTFRPIISNMAMRVAAVVIIGPLLILCFFSKAEQSTAAGNFAHNLITRINALPSLYVTIFIMTGMLLAADLILTKKLKHGNTDKAKLV